MANFNIITESLSERCEICHKVDQFDPFNNHCTRCSNVKLELQNKIRLNNFFISTKFLNTLDNLYDLIINGIVLEIAISLLAVVFGIRNSVLFRMIFIFSSAFL